MEKESFAIRLIDALGGTCEVARLCDIKPPSVTGWKTYGIPKPWIKYFEQIRPDLFADNKKAA